MHRANCSLLPIALARKHILFYFQKYFPYKWSKLKESLALLFHIIILLSVTPWTQCLYGYTHYKYTPSFPHSFLLLALLVFLLRPVPHDRRASRANQSLQLGFVSARKPNLFL